MDTSQNPLGVCYIVPSGQVAKQHESSFLYDSREGRLFRHKLKYKKILDVVLDRQTADEDGGIIVPQIVRVRR